MTSVNISPQKATAILKKRHTTMREFKRVSFGDCFEGLLPKGGKLKYTADRGYYLFSYSAGDCEIPGIKTSFL